MLSVGALAFMFSGRGLGSGQLAHAYEGLWAPSSEGASPGPRVTVGCEERTHGPSPLLNIRPLGVNFVFALLLRVAHALILA